MQKAKDSIKAVIPCQHKIILRILVFYFNMEPSLK